MYGPPRRVAPSVVSSTVLALVITLVTALAGGGVPSASAQSVMEGPPPAPFYHADPAALAAAKPGQVINRRHEFMLAFNEWPVTEIAYHSTNTRGEPILATATVIRAHDSAPDAPVLSYQHYLDALGQNCAPTETLVNPTLETVQDNVMAFLRLQLRKGWTTVIPDHLGPNSSYPGGELSGRITLDGMRAVRDDPAFDARHSRFAALGYSGGDIPTAWTAAMHRSYAPDVDLVGAAQGGVPTDLMTMACHLGNAPYPAFGLAFAAAVGLAREYPEIRLEDKLTPVGWSLYDKVKGGCTARLVLYGAFKSVPQVLRGGDLWAETALLDAFRRASVMNSPEVPDVPVHMGHSRNDPLVPFWDAEAVSARYCREGTPVTWVPGDAPEHLLGAVEKLPEALSWIESRFAGQPAPRACHV